MKTYADLRFSTGDTYQKNGFTLVKYSKLDYWYTDGKIRVNRIKFKADKKRNLSEKQVVDEFNSNYANNKEAIPKNLRVLTGKVRPIYGCGSALFELPLVGGEANSEEIRKKQNEFLTINRNLIERKCWSIFEEKPIFVIGFEFTLVKDFNWNPYLKNWKSFNVMLRFVTDNNCPITDFLIEVPLTSVDSHIIQLVPKNLILVA